METRRRGKNADVEGKMGGVDLFLGVEV